MSKETGYESAVNLAVEQLQRIDLISRCSILGLPEPRNGSLSFRAFGLPMILNLDDFQVFHEGTEKPVKIADRILILHYLLCPGPIHHVESSSELITFRQLDSGMFYLEAFLSRSIRPLVSRIGNDLEMLRKNLNRFDWEPVAIGDIGARIHALGKVYVTLSYQSGDDEFPPEARILFEPSIKTIYPTEDVAVLAGRICFGLC